MDICFIILNHIKMQSFLSLQPQNPHYWRIFLRIYIVLHIYGTILKNKYGLEYIFLTIFMASHTRIYLF